MREENGGGNGNGHEHGNGVVHTIRTALSGYGWSGDSIERNLPKIVRILMGVGILRRGEDGDLALDADLVEDEEAWGVVISEMEKQGVARVAEGS